MKKTSKILLAILIIIICLVSIIEPKNIFSINTKKYKAGYNDTVSTRELAMLASLVYEDVPDDDNYVDDSQEGCIRWNGSLETGCFFKALEEKYVTLSKQALDDDENISLMKKDTGLKVFQYIEGMSERKTKSIVSAATAAFQEDGEQYYFLNFAHAKELEEQGWTIYDYATIQTESGSLIGKILGKNNINFQGVFDAITFKRGDNYVIAYRGTDYPDLLEWIQDVGYAFEGEHAEAAMAYKYAQDIYTQIIRQNSNAKIYVTGHSLGAYLAQVGGAAIVDKEAGISYKEGVTPVKNYQSYEDYKADYYKKNSNLVQVAYFNGMGIGGVFSSNNFIRSCQNALIYLSTHSANGQIYPTNRNLSYSNTIKSSGRLISYSMEGDPISSIGFHYGEIYKLEAAADAITNHRGRHESVLGEALPEIFTGLDSILEVLDLTYKFETNRQLISIAKGGISALTNKKLGNMPTTVVNQIKSENNGIDITRFNLGSLVDNLNSDLQRFSEKYGLTNLFDHFNTNHETDSFVCLKDADNGYINSVDIEVSSAKLSCTKDTCYTNKRYTSKNFKFTAQTNTSKHELYNITLTAKIDGACAKSYTWYASADGHNWRLLGTTTDNRIVVPDEFFTQEIVNGKLKEGKVSHYFKVAATYGDTYNELKSTFSNDSSIIKYANSGVSYNTNPTINDGVTIVEKTTVSSPAKQVSLVTDITKPSSCTLPSTTKNVELECGFLGLFCDSKRVSLDIRCSDKGSAAINSGFDKNAATSLKLETSNTGLIDSIELDGKNVTTGNPSNTSIYVNVKRKPTFLTPKVIIQGSIKDRAGNAYTLPKTTISFKITEK